MGDSRRWSLALRREMAECGGFGESALLWYWDGACVGLLGVYLGGGLGESVLLGLCGYGYIEGVQEICG